MSPQAKEDEHEPPSFDANNAEEALDTEAKDQPATKSSTSPITATPKKPNAFEKLMSSPQERTSKRIKTNPSSTGRRPSQHLTRPGRDGLGIYQQNPSSFSSDVVVYHNSSFVVIRDMYPKASVHLLLLPRTEKDTLHPFVAFQDEELLATTRAEAEKVRALVGEELRRLFGKGSEAERGRRKAIASGAEGEVPPGRDWEREVMVGVHAGPSMNHLHVHVLSRDMMSSCLKHRKHYNSFNTDFFVQLDELPLEESDGRWGSDRGGGLRKDFKCWRCGKGFENKFEKLKKHLAEEFELWKAE